MNTEEFKEFSLAHQAIDDCWLEGFFSLQEMKVNPCFEENKHSLNAGEKKTNGKGKGRPKGEVNDKKADKRRKESSGQQNNKKGHWSLDENKRYHWFLEMHHHHFICKEMRRLDKIFKSMATFIGTREAEQCRSHHQKMEKKHFSFPKILFFLRMSHYGTEDTTPIYQDLHNNLIVETNEFLSPQYLQRIEGEKETPKTPELPYIVAQEENRQPENEVLISKEINFEMNHSFHDLFGDNYEEQLELDNLLL